MVGEIDTTPHDHPHAVQAGKVRLELKNLIVRPGDPPLNLQLKAEIVGLTGLIRLESLSWQRFSMVCEGCFRRNLARWLTAETRIDFLRDPQGVHLVPEDRSNRAVIPQFSVNQNLSLPFLRSFCQFALRNRERSSRKPIEWFETWE